MAKLSHLLDLPELFPTRLRATGASFCYNIGRVIAAGGPFLVGVLGAKAASGAIGVAPLPGLLLMPLIIEPRGRALMD